MAYCVLCGKKVGLLDQIDLDFHGSKQVLCSACDVRMSKASPGERQDLEQQILASPYLQRADTVQANVNTGKVCPACGSGETWLLRGNEVEIKEIEVKEK